LKKITAKQKLKDKNMALTEKLIQARTSLGKIQKTKSKDLKYPYYSSEVIISSAKNAFNEAGLLIYPAKIQLIADDEITTKTGAILRQTTVLMTYVIVDTESSDVINMQALGRAQDMAEKNLSKAQTQAFKTALMQLLMIADDIEASESSHNQDGEVTSKKIEEMIADVKNEGERADLIKLINELTDNKEKSRLMKLLNSKNGVNK